jgi:hypothetical protein
VYELGFSLGTGGRFSGILLAGLVGMAWSARVPTIGGSRLGAVTTAAELVYRFGWIESREKGTMTTEGLIC